MNSTKAVPAKEQRFISSFFAPKPVNGARVTSTIQKQEQAGSHIEDIYDPESDDDHPRVGVEASFTSKRPLAEASDTVNNGKGRPEKRAKWDGESIFFIENQVEEVGSQKGSISQDSMKQLKSLPRAEHYMYNGSSQIMPSNILGEEEQDDEDTRRQKELLHQKFVKKLGNPDCTLMRWKGQIPEDTGHQDEDEDGDGDGVEVEEESGPLTTKRKGAKTGKLTPMELQMLKIKRNHMDAILIIEVGYKFKFFGEDARLAAKELGIVCIPGKLRFDEHPSEAHLDRFASASIPVHRLPVHVKRLVLAGYKVGVVRQVETAALKKAGDNRNTPFIRELTNLYTKGTYIDDTEGLTHPAPHVFGSTRSGGYVLCITENNSKVGGTDERVDVGILAVQPTTGDIIHDNFEDGFIRSEIETRLLHISPCEFLIVGNLTKATEKLIQHLSRRNTNVFGDKIRIERVGKPKTMAAQSYSHVAQFYAGKMEGSKTSDNEVASNLLDKILNLPELVTVCLSAMITHMTEYGLEHVFDLTKYFQSFSARSHMLINGNTLTSLELYHNQTDYTERGSLFWTLDKTQTRFGQRLLRKWVGRPLIDKEKLEERTEAVQELKDHSHTTNVDKLKSLLMKVKSDLERNLLRIYYGKCTRPELLNFLQTMQRIANEFAHIKSAADAGFKSPLLNEAIATLPVIGEIVISFLDGINLEAARSNDKYSFFREGEETEDITDHKLGIASVEQDLEAHRSQAAEKIRKKKVTYATVSGIEYLIEVSNTDLKHVPASWVKISGTKKLSRFHTPEVVRMTQERDQRRESLAAACDTAFTNLLAEIATHYQAFRDCVTSLASLDCLLSLATVAAQPGYVKPEYTDTPEVSIIGGRHPMIEQLLLSEYIPNDTALSSSGTRALLITGPNMGGKSSYVRQVALICIMAQIGSYVPATSARLGMLDAVFTRMGAFDNMMAGESTFMVELSETSDILKQASPRSLVILDELGRGTSTHDGVAIAQAVLDHVVRETKCLTLFITHYQTLSSVARGFGYDELKNVHMRFTEQGKRGEEEVTFLFQIGEGTAHRSYGLNAARLARVPKPVLDVAAVKSREMEEDAQKRKLTGLGKVLGSALEGSLEQLDLLVRGIEQL